MASKLLSLADDFEIRTAVAWIQDQLKIGIVKPIKSQIHFWSSAVEELGQVQEVLDIHFNVLGRNQ